MKYPPKSIAFRSRVIGLPYSENELTGAYSCRKDVSKISANFGNCDGVYFQKRITSITRECALKKNSATIVFLYCWIIQRRTNISTLYKSFDVLQILRRSKKSFNVVQIIQCNTNHSTSYKSFNAVQIIRRRTNFAAK